MQQKCLAVILGFVLPCSTVPGSRADLAEWQLNFGNIAALSRSQGVHVTKLSSWVYSGRQSDQRSSRTKPRL